MFVEVPLLILFVNNVCFILCEYYYDGTTINRTYKSAFSSLDIQSVFTDLFEVLLTSDSPADSFNSEESYTGLFLRLPWHGAATFCTQMVKVVMLVDVFVIHLDHGWIMQF